jgi:hypothetical protein
MDPNVTAAFMARYGYLPPGIGTTAQPQATGNATATEMPEFSKEEMDGVSKNVQKMFGKAPAEDPAATGLKMER